MISKGSGGGLSTTTCIIILIVCGLFLLGIKLWEDSEKSEQDEDTVAINKSNGSDPEVVTVQSSQTSQ